MSSTMDPATIATAKGLFVARKSRLLGMAASLTAAGLALTACSGQPGAAAVVDGERISENEVAATVEVWQPLLQNPLTPAGMLAPMIQAPVLLDVAAEHGIAASAEEAEQYLDDLAEQGQLETPEEYPAGALEVARMQMVVEELNSGSVDPQQISADLTERIGALDVELSPRYGDWDPEAAGGSFITPTTPEWILAPVDETEAETAQPPVG